MRQITPFLISIIMLMVASLRSNCQISNEVTFIDSINHILESYQNPKEKIIFLLRQIEDIRPTDRKLAKVLADSCLSYANEDTENQLKVELAKAQYWQIESVIEDSTQSQGLPILIEKLKQALLIFEGEKNKVWAFKTLSLISQANYYAAKDSIAFDRNNQALQLIKNIQEERDYLVLRGNLFRIRANIFNYYPSNLSDQERQDSVLSNYKKAEFNYKKAKAFDKQSRLMDSKATYYSIKNDFVSANKIYEEAIQFDINNNGGRTLDEIYLNYGISIGKQYLEENQYNLIAKSDSLLHLASANSPTEYALLYYQLAANKQNSAIYLHQEEDVEYGEYLKESGELYNTTIEYGVKERKKHIVDDAFEAMTKVCDVGGEEICKKLMVQLRATYNGIYKEQVSLGNQIMQEQIAFSSLERDTNNKLWKRWAFIVILTIVFVFAGIYALGVVIYIRRDNKHLKEKEESRLQTLRAQMNPHFISNALTAIDSLVLQDRNDEASTYIVNFGRLSRMILENSKEALIDIERELTILKDYLSIEKLRFEDRLNIHYEIDESLNLDMYMIPPLILQPYAENAILHGIGNKKDESEGNVWVRIQPHDEDYIKCVIEDDGIGRKEAERLKKLKDPTVEKKSFGMSITNERLESLNLKDASVKIRDLYNDNDQPQGTQVNILLPKIPK